jgi:single-stranded-DNA-specific exonuclease
LIADVALLKGETRAMVQKGIQALRKSNRLGLKTVAELSETNLELLTEETIGFTFAPRLNALGRLSDANPAVEFLLTEDPVRARVLATQIEGLNTQRRLLTSQVYEAAEAQLLENPNLLTEPVIVLSHRDWPGGVVGIVANKLVERYQKPALLLTETEDGMLRGSARSITGVHITAAIASNKERLISFGGHPMAAGLSLRSDQFQQFRKGLNKAVEKMLGEAHIQEGILDIEDWIRFEDISLELADQIEQLAPFGAGNPLPVLATAGLTLESARELGRTKEHRKLVVLDENQTRQEVLWWNSTGEELPTGKFDMAYSVRASTFRGERRTSLVFKDFRVLNEKTIERHKPRVEIRDLRLHPSDFRPEPSILVWSEGSSKSKGVDRFQLRESEEFAIWTTPPSLFELRSGLEIVKPTTIYLLAVTPKAEKPDEFLTRLAGMTKFAISQRGGKVSIRSMATATAQRETTIRLGLEWLAAGGHLSVEGDEDELQLSSSPGSANPYLQRELYISVKGLLEETAAYRAHFTRAAAEQLIKL